MGEMALGKRPEQGRSLLCTGWVDCSLDWIGGQVWEAQV